MHLTLTSPVQSSGRFFTRGNVRGYCFGFNGKEKVDEVYGDANAYDFSARLYDPRLGRWLALDPLAYEFPMQSPYISFNDNPIIFIDPDGRAAVNTKDGGGDPDPAGYYAARSLTRTIGIAIRHPNAAVSIGISKPGSLNISSVSSRFAANIGLQEDESNMGSQVNAFRHVLWQASISAEFGTDIATQVGNAHEENPFAIKDVDDPSSKIFNSLESADETIDLLNNIIGREIGANNPNATAKELAMKSLDYYKNNGLWIASKQADGSYKISQVKLTNAEYVKYKAEVQARNIYGYNSKQWIDRQESAKVAAEKEKAKMLRESKL